MALKSGHYLTRYLEPLRPWLDEAGVSEISVNVPGKVWIEAAGTVSYTHLTLPTKA